MSKNGNGFFSKILLIFRLLFTAAFTVAVFALLLGFVAFRCMHPAGSRMLAYSLSSYPVVDLLPKIYFSSTELEQILKEQSAPAQEEASESVQTAPAAEKADMLLASPADRQAPPPEEDSGILLMDGFYIIAQPDVPDDEPVQPAAAEKVQKEPEPTVLYGCVNGDITTYLRLKPSLESRKELTIEPGTWCTVLAEEKQFYKIFYNDGEYYIYKDRLDIYEVPELPGGLTVPGLPEATDEEIRQMLMKENDPADENENLIMYGTVDGIVAYRTAPSFTGAQTGFLDAGTQFLITGEENMFYKFEMNGTEYYIYKEKVHVEYKEAADSTQSEAPLPESEDVSLEG